MMIDGSGDRGVGMGEDALVARRQAKLGTLLAATDAPVPAIAFPEGRIAFARRRRAQWRMAAVIAVILAGAAAAVPPVRAWIAGAARQLLPGAPSPAPALSTSRPPDPATPPSAIGFAVDGSTFTLDVATRQAGGGVRLVRSADASAHARLDGDPTDAGLIVMPDGLRILNGRGARADYVIELPASVQRVVLLVGSEPRRSFPWLGDSLAVPLDASEPAAPARLSH